MTISMRYLKIEDTPKSFYLKIEVQILNYLIVGAYFSHCKQYILMLQSKKPSFLQDKSKFVNHINL